MGPVHKLTVLQAWEDDVYRDIARVFKEDRDDIPEGTICKIWNINSGKVALSAVRGLPESARDHIMLDAFGRERLGIKQLSCFQFKFEKVGWLGTIQWACRSAEPGARIAAWIGVVSLGLGVLAILLGLIAIALAIPPLLK